MCKKKTIGVLALQGAVEVHQPHIEAAGAEYMAVKTAADFTKVDGFILPGGESTTMLKLIERFNLWDALAAEFAKKHVWGICAGSILMAETVHYSHLRIEDNAGDVQKSFSLLPMTVERNAYGTQLDSHQSKINDYPVSFIRAPKIVKTDDSIDIIAQHDNTAAWVKKDQYMATTFHPELTLNFPSPMHQAFVDLVTR